MKTNEHRTYALTFINWLNIQSVMSKRHNKGIWIVIKLIWNLQNRMMAPKAALCYVHWCAIDNFFSPVLRVVFKLRTQILIVYVSKALCISAILVRSALLTSATPQPKVGATESPLSRYLFLSRPTLQTPYRPSHGITTHHLAFRLCT